MNQALDNMLGHYITPKMDKWDKTLPVHDLTWLISIKRPFRTPRSSLIMADILVSHWLDGAWQTKQKSWCLKLSQKHWTSNGKRAQVCLKDAHQCQQKYADAKRRDLELNVGNKAWVVVPLLLKAQIAHKCDWAPKASLKVKRSYKLDIPPHYRLNTSFHVSLLNSSKPVCDNSIGLPQKNMR